MLVYIIRRILMLIPILILMSMVAFFLIELPPGDWVSTRITQLEMSGVQVSADEAARLIAQYGLDKPMPVRYWRWVEGIVMRGNWGFSMQWNKPVNEILAERVPMTIVISLSALLLSWIVAIPIGIYSATHQYSFLDYVFTILGFIGVATPGFLLALILAWVLFAKFGFSMLGLYSREYLEAPWSFAKFLDLLKHIWLPLILVGMGNTAGTIRVVRNNLLDELNKQYVIAARSKGLSEWKLLLKYPVRLAINPLLSTVSFILPGLVSGSVLIDIVLSLQTTGPVLLRATLAQDMYLAGSIVLILSALTVVGALLGDLLLIVVDPRIRFGRAEK
ncbi:MAG: Inner membrane ABC transporter permease protein YejB [Chloroflexi bacterium ADurb.Bin325]|nr:MAG: Inner membrane ABC transporter permease protein YejB [Chloroflexi bacterium ADurb.Bin325]